MVPRVDSKLRSLASRTLQQARTYRNRLAMFLLETQNTLRTIGPEERVLFWVPGGMPLMLDVEGVIAKGIQLRGAKILAVICDGTYQACVQREITAAVPIAAWRRSCAECRRSSASVLSAFNIPYRTNGSFLSAKKLRELRDQAQGVTWETLDSLSEGSVSLGTNVRSAVLRYLKGDQIPQDPRIVSEYAFSALVTAASARKAIEEFRPTRIFLSHGIYCDWGPALRVGRSLNIPTVGWMASYLPSRFYFRHVDNAELIDFHTTSSAYWSQFVMPGLSDLQNDDLDTYLNNRYQSDQSFDMRRFVEMKEDPQEILNTYKLSSTRPRWLITCHINWDGVSDYSPMLFSSFNEWILRTIEEIISIPQIDWLIKIHPAEAWDNKENGIEALVDSKYPRLPEHIKLIRAKDSVNPLQMFSLVQGGVTVYGTAGLELALLGKPVVLAGQAHYGGHGFTYDSECVDHYFSQLRNAATLKPLDSTQLRLARTYAYLYFLRRQIPLPMLKSPHSKWWRFDQRDRHCLLPGRDPFLDLVCSRIIDGGEFALDDELYSKMCRLSP